MFLTGCVLCSLVFYNSMVLIIPLMHLGDDHTCRRILYLHPYRFNNGFVVIGFDLSILCEVLG